jgi:regulator of protease activity HflC (stomatin/prohibitin superfamily)
MQNRFGVFVTVIVLVLGLFFAAILIKTSSQTAGICIGLCAFVAALLLGVSIKVADQWDRAVLLRLGKFHGLRGPGLFFIVPVLDAVAYWIDLRVITTTFTAEKTLTKDTVPVDVDAVLFWKVVNPEKAALEVADYRGAIAWAAQTALRDVIGKTVLADMLVGREKIDAELQHMIDERTEQWGIRISSVEIRDVIIPTALQDAMSMEAQAERERQARVILGDSERQIANKFLEAAKLYATSPTALHLRAMNMLYEGLKERATLVIVPSTAVDSMQLGSVAAMAALSKGLTEEFLEQEKSDTKGQKLTEKERHPDKTL